MRLRAARRGCSGRGSSAHQLTGPRKPSPAHTVFFDAPVCFQLPCFIYRNILACISSRNTSDQVFWPVTTELIVAWRVRKVITARRALQAAFGSETRRPKLYPPVNKRVLSTGETGEFASENAGFELNRGGLARTRAEPLFKPERTPDMQNPAEY